MKILLTYDYGKEAMDSIKALGYDVAFCSEKAIASFEQKETVDVLICYSPFQYVDLRLFKKLKYIMLSSIGFDQLPQDLVKEMAITVCNNRGGYSIPMGEWIVMKVLELVKHSKFLYENQREKKWFMDSSITELYNKRILFFGTGTIAHEAAKRLQGFNMTVIGLNTSGRAKEYFDECYALEKSVEEVRKADAVVIALPLTAKTHYLFEKKHIEALSKHAVLINVARGEIIDENLLVKALEDKSFKAAALDVFHQEPLPKDHPLWQLDNVILTNHNSWMSEMRNERRFETIYKNLQNLKNKESLINVIDLVRGY